MFVVCAKSDIQTGSGKESAGSGKRHADALRYFGISDDEPNVKNLPAICVVSLLVGMTAVTAGQDRGDGDIRDRFAGAWRLAWLEQ